MLNMMNVKMNSISQVPFFSFPLQIYTKLTLQEDEDELSRRKDQQEDIDIDVLSPYRDFPRRPDPLLVLPPNLSEEEREVVEKSVRAMEEVMIWADEGNGDQDAWEGFFISVDMLEKSEEDEDERDE
jgi:hypothetical protein